MVCRNDTKVKRLCSKVKTVLTKDIEDNIKKFPDANLKAINDLQAKVKQVI